MLREPFGAQPRKLVLLNVDGSGERDLFAFDRNETYISVGWSADGQWVNLALAYYGFAPATIVYRLATNRPTPVMEQVTQSPFVMFWWEEHRVTGQVAVLRLNAQADSIQVALYHPATQGYTSIAWLALPRLSVGWKAAWSADGRYIAVVWGRGNNIHNHLLLFDVAARRLHSDRAIAKLPDDPGFSWGPWPVP